jgi:hypothetical protein
MSDVSKTRRNAFRWLLLPQAKPTIKGLEMRKAISLPLVSSIFFTLFNSCASIATRVPDWDGLQARLNSWNGKQVDDLYFTWGTPTGTQNLSDGSTIITYRYSKIYDHGSAGFSQLECNVNIMASNKTIVETNYDGNYGACNDYIKVFSVRPSTFGGIGMTLDSTTNGRAFIKKVLENGPADKAGIHESDVIESIDGIPVSLKKIKEIILMLRGNPGSNVNVCVGRSSGKETGNYCYSITRIEFRNP